MLNELRHHLDMSKSVFGYVVASFCSLFPHHMPGWEEIIRGISCHNNDYMPNSHIQTICKTYWLDHDWAGPSNDCTYMFKAYVNILNSVLTDLTETEWAWCIGSSTIGQTYQNGDQPRKEACFCNMKGKHEHEISQVRECAIQMLRYPFGFINQRGAFYDCMITLHYIAYSWFNDYLDFCLEFDRDA